MRIAEIFRSIQGEGRLTGTESIFVRVSGCNLRCNFCDTPYASWTPEGADLSVSEILDRIDELRRSPSTFETPGIASSQDVRHVVLTGGEPMLFSEMIPLTAALRAERWHITVETAGTLYLPVDCDLMSISPKLVNSTPSPERNPQWTWRHTVNRHVPDVIRRLTTEYEFQLKFVIADPDDCREVELYLTEFPAIDRGRVMLMPEGVDADVLAERTEWLVPYCESRGLQFCPRRHIEWFGAVRGT